MLSLSDHSSLSDLLLELLARGYELETGEYSVRRPDRQAFPLKTPDGVPAVAKCYRHGGGEAAFANAVAVWQSSFGQDRQPLAVPQPLAYEADLALAVFVRHPGAPMEIQRQSETDSSQWEHAIDLLVDLHRSDAKPTTRRSARGVLRSLLRRLEWIRAHSPAHETVFEKVILAMEARRHKGSGLVPSHGDFSTRNILIHEETMVVIDWDRFQWADPARDLAYLATSNWLAALRRGRKPSHELLRHLAHRYETVCPENKVRSTLPFYVAAALLRRAASLLELWPEERYLAGPLLNLALEEVV